MARLFSFCRAHTAVAKNMPIYVLVSTYHDKCIASSSPFGSSWFACVAWVHTWVKYARVCASGDQHLVCMKGALQVYALSFGPPQWNWTCICSKNTRHVLPITRVLAVFSQRRDHTAKESKNVPLQRVLFCQKCRKTIYLWFQGIMWLHTFH